MADFPLVILVTESGLDINDLVDQITLPTTGAVVVFSGIVRGETEREKRETHFLEYEAYKPMAEAKMRQVAHEIWERWPIVQGIVVAQRIGTLKPRTITTVIACAAAHRDNGVFDAAHYGIDRLKEIVPVWKKEFGPSGEEWVSGHYIPKAGE